MRHGMRWLILLLLIACSAPEIVVEEEPTVIIKNVSETEPIIEVQYAEFKVTTLTLLEKQSNYWQYEYKNGDYIIIEKKRLENKEFWRFSSAYFGEYDYGTRATVQKALDIVQLGNKELEEKQSMLTDLQWTGTYTC